MNTRKAEIYEFLMLDFLSNDFLCADPEIVISRYFKFSCKFRSKLSAAAETGSRDFYDFIIFLLP